MIVGIIVKKYNFSRYPKGAEDCRYPKEAEIDIAIPKSISLFLFL